MCSNAQPGESVSIRMANLQEQKEKVFLARMTSLAFQKFKSLERRPSNSSLREIQPSEKRPSPDQGLGSSLSSSNASLQQQSPTKVTDTQQRTMEEAKQDMSQLRAQFFNDQLAVPKSKQSKDSKPPSTQPDKKLISKVSLDRRKSADDGIKLDALSKGNCNEIKTMFEENIAIKKGIIPDPNLPQGPVVKMRRKVNPNLPNTFGKLEDPSEASVKKRESIPIDRKMFTHFLNKFEDDLSRQAGKNQLWRLTQQQKTYLKEAKSWSRKQEEKKEMEERQKMEEIKARELEAQRKAEEEERKVKDKEKEEKRRKEEEELLLKAATLEAEKKTKKKKKKKGQLAENSELPNLVANTCSDLRRRFQESLKASVEPQSTKVNQLERPKVRKLVDNPFEKQMNQNNEDQVLKRREFPQVRENRLGDLKKRFSQFMSASSETTHQLSTSSGANNHQDSDATSSTESNNNKKEKIENNKTLNNEERSNELIQAEVKRKSIIQSSVHAIKGSFEKLSSSKEKLQGDSKRNTLTSRPSKTDMQSYLISHVLYDGKVKMEALPPAKEEEDDFLSKLEEEIIIPEEELMNDEYIKGLQKYLALFDDKKKSKKKKKKKTILDEPPKVAPLKIVQVSSIKEQFERQKKASLLPSPIKEGANEPTNFQIEPTVGKVKSLFEKREEADAPQKPLVRRRLINNALIQKFDCPEMVEELKKQKEKEREERKQERLRKLEEERQRIDAEMRKAKKLEEERLERERLEQLRREEDERAEKERVAEEARRKAAFEQMLVEEKLKADQRKKNDQEKKEMREKSEPAFRQKKVLGRIQHIFQKKLEEEENSQRKGPVVNIGSVKGVGAELFGKKDDTKHRLNQNSDPTLASTGGVLSSVINKFEAKEDEPVIISHGVPRVKKDIPAALAFARNEQKMLEKSMSSPKPKNDTEWSWKKKSAAELLASEMGLTKSSENGLTNNIDSKKAQKIKKSFDRQKELLDDIHEVNKRLSKKNALKEHEAKMEEYSKLMDDIQLYLSEPDKSAEESTFKDDVKNYITSKVNKKKTKAKILQPQHTQQQSWNSIQKIKEQLLQPNDSSEKVFDSNISNEGKVSALKSTIMEQYLNSKLEPAIDNQVSTTNSVSAIKEVFEIESGNGQLVENQGKNVVRKKLIQLPHEEIEEKTSPRKESYEWKYKKKSLQELNSLMTSNQAFVTSNVLHAMENAGKMIDTATDQNDMLYKESELSLMNQVEDYLNAPDRSQEEIEFKEQIEKFLDTIEERTYSKGADQEVLKGSLSRKPKKLDLSVFMKNLEEDSKTPEDVNSPIFYPKAKDTVGIKEIQKKLLEDSKFTRECSNEVIIHNAGTNAIKREYELLSKEKRQDLMSVPKVQAQKSFGEMLNKASTEGVKSLEQIKNENKENTWSWKQKTIGDLHTYLTGHLSHASKAVVDSHKSILKADIEIQNEQGSSMDASMIIKLTRERDEEMEKFLANVEDYLNQPTTSSKEGSIKEGIQSYLNLINTYSTTKQDKGDAPIKLLGSGVVSNVKTQLERNQITPSLNKTQRSVGKISTQFLENPKKPSDVAEKKQTAISPSNSRSEDIKQQLVKQFFSQENMHQTFKAPKAKLVAQPDTTVEVPSKIEPRKVWQPPQQPKSAATQKPKANPEKKKEGEKEEKYISKYAHIQNEDERKAAILAQFGCKPRPALQQQRSNSSSTNSSSDDDDDMSHYIENDLMKNNELYVLYGDRLRASSPKRQSRPRKQQQVTSVDCLKGILGTIRQRSATRHELDSETDGAVSRSPQGTRNVERSNSCANVGYLFEQSVKEKQLQGLHSQYSERPTGRILIPNLDSSDSPPRRGFLPGLNNSLARSSSFHKFKQSFETGQFDSGDECNEEEDAGRQTEQRSQIESELDELRSCTRLQKMFSINKPKMSVLERSSSSSAVSDFMRSGLNGEDSIPTVAEARSSIRNIFEASAFKVTYGGGKTLTEQLREKEKTPEPQPKKKVQFSDRTWVLDTINKYFDVIEEDEDEEENNDYEENEEDEDFEDDYDEEEEDSDDDNQVFSTQVSAQSFVYPNTNHGYGSNQNFSSLAETYELEEDIELDVDEECSDSEEEEDDDERQFQSTSLLRSASSTRIRGLFNSVLKKSASGADLDMSRFKANLDSHLQRRQSFSSNANLQDSPVSDNDEDDELFQDCSETPMETSKYYRIPL